MLHETFDLLDLKNTFLKNIEILKENNKNKQILLINCSIKKIYSILEKLLYKHNILFSHYENSIFIKTENIDETIHFLLEEAELSKWDLHYINFSILNAKEDILKYLNLTNVFPIQTWCSKDEYKKIKYIFKEKKIKIMFQPILDIKNQKIYAYECLARGIDQDQIILNPEKLFDIVKKCNLSTELDFLIGEKILNIIDKKQLHDNRFFLNILPTSLLTSHNYIEKIFSLAHKINFSMKNIVFEIVETEYIDNNKLLSEMIEFYKLNGLKIALDDVGSGYSSLINIVTFHPNFIKIDKEIISGIHNNSIKQSIYTALKNITKEHNIKILAEGVEKEEDFDYLINNDIDFIQGYIIGKPSENLLTKEEQKYIVETFFRK